jgi:peptide/nickel transport system substrate-binding protein
VIIKNEPARVFFGDTLIKRKFDGLMLFTWVASPQLSPKIQIKSDEIPSEKNGWSGQNFTGYSSKKVDELLEKLDLEFNPAKQKQIAQEIMKCYTQDLPVIPLYYRSDIAAIPAKMEHFRLAAHQFYETMEAEKWDIKK